VEEVSTEDKPRFVAGSMGPGTKLITLGNTDWDAMLARTREQARGADRGGRMAGVDVFIIETCQDLLQVKCAINAVLAALRERGGRRRCADHGERHDRDDGDDAAGDEIEAAATALAGYPIARWG
jgi:5-methyltetrahydrofolate--homocysteine methyltransferase